jgi:hypothetical protein
MGHAGVKGLSGCATNLPAFDTDDFTCDVCSLSNIKRIPFPRQTSHRAERVHSDVCGPLDEGYLELKYFMLIIDDYSRYTHIYCLQTKSQVPEKFLLYKSQNENWHNSKIVFLRADNAPEFVNGELRKLCDASGITYERTTPDAPPQNGVSERHNYTLHL